MTTVAIVNPRAAGGRAGRVLRRLEHLLADAAGEVEVLLTSTPGDATRLTSAALHGGAARVIAIGGDGTLGDVVNGFLVDGVVQWPEAELGVIQVGTGGDFRRSFGARRSLEESVERSISARPLLLDVGVMRVGTSTRAFVNGASVGLSAQIATSVNAAPRLKRALGALSFAPAAVHELSRYQPVHITVTIDEGRTQDLAVVLIAICNGPFFGGGMHVAPGARLDDGLLDVLVVEHRGRGTLLGAFPRLYGGTHLSLPYVQHHRVRRVDLSVAPSGRSVPYETDGESGAFGSTASFAILPGALRVRY